MAWRRAGPRRCRLRSRGLTAGRYTIEVPPGALPAPAIFRVTSREPQTGYVICELAPHGAAFDVPVTLRIDLSDLDLDPTGDYTVYWFDEDAGEWTDVGGVYDPEMGVLSSELPHFSKYGAGRAGRATARSPLTPAPSIQVRGSGPARIRTETGRSGPCARTDRSR